MSDDGFTPPGPPLEPTHTPPTPQPPYAVDPYAMPVGAPLPSASWGHQALRPAAPSGLAIATLVLSSCLMAVLVGLALTAGASEDAYAEGARLGVWPELNAFDLLGLLQIPVVLATYVVTCLWLMKARSFAVAYRGADPHARRAAWVWFGWWVPFVSLLFPYQVVRDIWRSSRAGLHDGSPVLVLWWWCWLGTAVGIRVTDAQIPTGSIPQEASGLASAAIFTAVVGTLSFIGWVFAVRSIWVGQAAQEAAEALSAGARPA